jgi:transposase
VQICPGYQTIVPKLDSRPKTRAARRLIADNASVRAGLVRDALDRVDELEAAAAKLEKQIEVLVKASTTSLTTLVGVGAINAARILGEVIDVSRLSGQAAFGALSGTAPVPASSGRTDRWRLNRGGNRQLNRAIHSMALTQSRCDPRARSYLAAKRSAGKNDNEAMRCLKRHLARVVYRQLLSDRSRFP